MPWTFYDKYGQKRQASVGIGSGMELAYNEITANVSITATSSATANTAITASPVTFDGATTAFIEVFVARASTGTTSIVFVLYDGATELGLIESVATPNRALFVRRRITPTSAAHTYSVRAYVDAGTGTVTANTGNATGLFQPSYIRITKA